MKKLLYSIGKEQEEEVRGEGSKLFIVIKIWFLILSL